MQSPSICRGWNHSSQLSHIRAIEHSNGVANATEDYTVNRNEELNFDDLSVSLRSFSFAASHLSSGVHCNSLNTESFSHSWKLFSLSGVQEDAGTSFVTRKSGEAVMTVDLITSNILVANERACVMFGYNEKELCRKKKIYDLFSANERSKQEVLIEKSIDAEGNIVMSSGKVLEGLDSCGRIFPVSIWMKKIQGGDSPRCVIILEHVQATKSSFHIDAEGVIKDCDYSFALLHGYNEPSDLIGSCIKKCIPSLVLPKQPGFIEKSIKKQHPTCRTRDMVPFPATVKIKQSGKCDDEDESQKSAIMYECYMWVFTNISGLVSITKDGVISSSNLNFISTFLGYTGEELVNKSILEILPGFYTQIDLLSAGNNITKVMSGLVNTELEDTFSRNNDKIVDTSTPKSDKKLETSVDLEERKQLSFDTPIKINAYESLNAEKILGKCILEGHYYGQSKHKDGSLLPVLFEVKKIYKNNELFFCVWISRDLDEDGEGGVPPHDNDGCMFSYNTTYNASFSHFKEQSCPNTTPNDSDKDLYHTEYTTLACIGQGAFGFVNMAERKSDNEQVIVKFICKEKIMKDSWLFDETHGYSVSMEVYILSRVKHPNIVGVLGVYDSVDFFELVMKKHGDGIDLFSFIEYKPHMDEALISYMFRQVLFAVEYLHSKNILHRDIKDENIIVDRNFRLQLIDFGSATFIKEGDIFNTFCGTIEYCSPEVLLGNSYEGFELEMWSIGVTLYTLVFGEHPFFEIQETIRAQLFPPFKVSNELMFAISWMLNPEVQFRAKLKDILEYPWFGKEVDVSNYNYEKVTDQYSSEEFYSSDSSTDDLTSTYLSKSY